MSCSLINESNDVLKTCQRFVYSNYNNDNIEGVCFSGADNNCSAVIPTSDGDNYKCPDGLEYCPLTVPTKGPDDIKCSEITKLDQATCDDTKVFRANGESADNCNTNPEGCKVCFNYDNYQDGVYSNYNNPAVCVPYSSECDGYNSPFHNTCNYEPPPERPTLRKINFINNCNSPVKVVSTLNDDKWLGDNEPRCKGSYIEGENRINTSDGNHCTNFKQYVTPTLNKDDTYTLTESLFKVDADTPGGGGPIGTYYRPGVNYRGVWANISPTDNNFDNSYNTQGKAFEVSYGAGNNRDTFDVSGMIEGGCAGHLNPYENDFLMTDMQNCTKACVGGECSDTNPTPLQVSHRYLDLYMTPGGDTTDNRYKGMHTAIQLLSQDPAWRDSQKGNAGCISPSGEYNTEGNENTCNHNPSSDFYSCGWPWIYYDENKPYYLKHLGEELHVCSEPHLDCDSSASSESSESCKLNKECTKNPHIMTKIRNELYDCSRQQSEDSGKPPRLEYQNTANPKFNEFINIDLEVVDNGSCDMDRLAKPSLSCYYKNYTNGNSRQADPDVCTDGYAFQYDDAKSTSECFFTDEATIPEYTVTFCKNIPGPEPAPEPAPEPLPASETGSGSGSVPEPSSETGSESVPAPVPGKDTGSGTIIPQCPPSPSLPPNSINIRWEVNNNEATLVCNPSDAFKPPTPIIQAVCNPPNYTWSQNSDFRDNYCECYTPTPSEKWFKDSNGWTYNCGENKIYDSNPKPTAICDPSQGLVYNIQPDDTKCIIPPHLCSEIGLPEDNLIGGEWRRVDDTTIKYSCESEFRVKMDNGKPLPTPMGYCNEDSNGWNIEEVPNIYCNKPCSLKDGETEWWINSASPSKCLDKDELNLTNNDNGKIINFKEYLAFNGNLPINGGSCDLIDDENVSTLDDGTIQKVVYSHNNDCEYLCDENNIPLPNMKDSDQEVTWGNWVKNNNNYEFHCNSSKYETNEVKLTATCDKSIGEWNISGYNNGNYDTNYCICPTPNPPDKWTLNNDDGIWTYSCGDDKYYSSFIEWISYKKSSPTATCDPSQGLVYTPYLNNSQINDPYVYNCKSISETCNSLSNKPLNTEYGSWHGTKETELKFLCNNGYQISDNISDVIPVATCDYDRESYTWTINPSNIDLNEYCVKIVPPPEPQPPETEPQPEPKPPETDPLPSKIPSILDKLFNNDSDKVTVDIDEVVDTNVINNYSDDGIFKMYKPYTVKKYNTIKELSHMIDDFYEPNCSLHLNVDQETRLFNPGIKYLVENPGYSNCYN